MESTRTNDNLIKLLDSIKENDIDKVRSIVSQDKSLVHEVDGSGRTCLHFAAILNLPGIINLLHSFGADLNATDYDQYTSLVLAVRCKSMKAIEELISLGCDIQHKTKKNITPLHQAVSNNDLGMIDYLIQRGYRIEKDGPWSEFGGPIHWAANAGDSHLTMIQKLHQLGVFLDELDGNGGTALHISSGCGHVKLTTWLLENGANPNIQAKDGSTPLHLAVEFNHLNIIKILLHSTNIALLENKEHQSPYILAESKDDDTMIELFKERFKEGKDAPILQIQRPEFKDIREKRSSSLKDKGNEFFMKENLMKALEFYQKALSYKPNNHIVLGNLSIVYCKLRDFVKAEEYASLCIETNPDYVKGYYRKAIACLEQQSQEKRALGLEYFQKALKLDPNNLQLKMEILKYSHFDLTLQK